MTRQHFAFSVLIIILAVWLLVWPASVNAQATRSPNSQEWDKTLEAAKKEGKVRVSIPASVELRKQLEEGFKKRYGIEVEVFTARGSAAVRRMKVAQTLLQ